MTVENAWELFRKTGLPEAYQLYCALREKGGAEAWHTPSQGDLSCGKSPIENQIKF